jgi:hypothetical protein
MIATTLTQHVAAERVADLHRSAARPRLTAPGAKARRPLVALAAPVRAARRRLAPAMRG